MSQEQSPRLSHVGLYVNDVPKMIDFYTRVLGFVVSDGAPDGRITFLSRNPSDHHEVVLVHGRDGDPETPMVQQVSFNVGTLANVQRVLRKVREAENPGAELKHLRFNAAQRCRMVSASLKVQLDEPPAWLAGWD